MAAHTPPILRLPYELHQRIALELTSVNDTLSLANTCTSIGSVLKSSNRVWYRLLHLSGSIGNEYDSYHPERNYFERVLRIRQGKRLRCQNCLGIRKVRTVDCYIRGDGGIYCYPKEDGTHGKPWGKGLRRRDEEERELAFFGVYCEVCLGEKFLDMASFESIQEKSWDGIISPPLFRVQKWRACKIHLGEFDAKPYRFAPSPGSAHTLLSDHSLIPSIPRSDAKALMDAMAEEEATDEALKAIERRNEKLAKLTKRSQLQEREFMLEYMVEAYEDFYEHLHGGTPVDDFRVWWGKEVFGLPSDYDAVWDVPSMKSSRDPVRLILLRSYARKLGSWKVSRWADMLHDIGPGFKQLMKENTKSSAKVCSFSWSL
ncbi:hypothetical protein TWF718_009320 [Orbilia javanica]|uniref:F-box domain-containing protein n=1 Tax=Orbilia javanica TaxID=47235 RepID=A0AAN8MVU7_9PEZI